MLSSISFNGYLQKKIYNSQLFKCYKKAINLQLRGIIDRTQEINRPKDIFAGLGCLYTYLLLYAQLSHLNEQI